MPQSFQSGLIICIFSLVQAPAGEVHTHTHTNTDAYTFVNPHHVKIATDKHILICIQVRRHTQQAAGNGVNTPRSVMSIIVGFSHPVWQKSPAATLTDVIRVKGLCYFYSLTSLFFFYQTLLNLIRPKWDEFNNPVLDWEQLKNMDICIFYLYFYCIKST